LLSNVVPRSSRTSEQTAIIPGATAICWEKAPIEHYFRFGKDRPSVRGIRARKTLPVKWFWQNGKKDEGRS
jgi:hypothetical protein